MKERDKQEPKLNELIDKMCRRDFGVLDVTFLCQTLEVLRPRAPVCVEESTPLCEVVEALKRHRVGCVLVLDREQNLSGIFSERDFIVKVATLDEWQGRKVADFMTREPVAQELSSTVAYTLNLMSQGGFRHMPVLDAGKVPIGIVSIKDVVDYIVESYTSDLLSFPEPAKTD